MTDVGLQIEGMEGVQKRLRGIASRMVIPEPALQAGMEILEQGEAALFDGYGGKFVKTGATRASLTQSGGEGSVRRAHGQTIEFGTGIWYAKFLKRIGGPSGKPRGRKREGRSLVVKASRVTRAAVRETIMTYITTGELTGGPR